jgi:hypothetical protein
MAQYRVQVNHENVSGLAKDRFVNTWYVIAADDSAAILWTQDLVTAYHSVLTGQTNGVGEYFSVAVSRDSQVHEARVYDLSDPEPRVPVHTEAFTALTATDTVKVPNEVALCLSFQAEQVSGVNQARRRGRVFLGPFNASALGASGVAEDARPAGILLDDVEIMAEEILASTNGQWAVHSTLSSVLLPVDNGWIDNAWDTQRRRGVTATTRQTFS